MMNQAVRKADVINGAVKRAVYEATFVEAQSETLRRVKATEVMRFFVEPLTTFQASNSVIIDSVIAPFHQFP